MSNRRVISISMPDAQARAAEELARSENRTMSELVREALRNYEKQKRAEITAKYRKKAEQNGLTEADVVRIVKEFRAEERKKRNRPSK